MENFLLIFDELDDVYAMLGLVWRPIISFVCALALFFATGFLFVRVPLLAEALGGGLLTLGLLTALLERRQTSVIKAGAMIGVSDSQ